MVMITLVGEHQAREGVEFVYHGPLATCRECNLKTVCLNLDPGGRYRIIGLREIRHDCRMHEDGVRVVEVERIPTRCAVTSKLAIEGSTITLDGTNCDNLGCQHYRLCNPPGVGSNQKRKVASVYRSLDCPENHRMVEVDLE